MKSVIVKTMDWLVIITIAIAMLIAFHAAGVMGLFVAFIVCVTMTCFWFAISLLCSELQNTNKLLAEISGKLTKKNCEQ